MRICIAYYRTLVIWSTFRNYGRWAPPPAADAQSSQLTGKSETQLQSNGRSSSGNRHSMLFATAVGC